MKFVPWISFVAAAVIFHALLRGICFLLSSWIAYQNISLRVIKISILSFKGIMSFSLALFAFSFHFNELPTFFIVLILCFGGELKEHLRKRTTAAFSTSDSQNQRFFNVSLFFIFIFCLSAYLLNHFGWNPVPVEIAVIFEESFAFWWVKLIYMVSTFVLLRYLFLFAKHYRTLLYLAQSYGIALRKGKLKRIW